MNLGGRVKSEMKEEAIFLCGISKKSSKKKKGEEGNGGPKSAEKKLPLTYYEEFVGSEGQVPDCRYSIGVVRLRSQCETI
jgi:hypothetical protein